MIQHSLGYIITAANLGWVVGYSNGTFMPKAAITRAETVTIINRVLKRSVSAESIPEEYNTKYSDLTPDHWAFKDIIEASIEHSYVMIDGEKVWSATK